MSKVYFVVGGVFNGMEHVGTSVRNANFREIEKGTHEIFGPFVTEEEAEKVRDSRCRRNLDICWHKVYVLEYQRYSLSDDDLRKHVADVMFGNHFKP